MAIAAVGDSAFFVFRRLPPLLGELRKATEVRTLSLHAEAWLDGCQRWRDRIKNVRDGRCPRQVNKDNVNQGEL